MTKLTRIAPELPTADLSAAVLFYNQLGFDLVSQTLAGDYSIIERDGIVLHLFATGDTPATPVGIHFFTPALEDVYQEFQRRGVHFEQEIERKPWGNRDFRLKDTFGNELKFTEPLAD